MDIGRAENIRELSLLLIIGAMVACSGTAGTEPTTSSVTTTIPSTTTTSPPATPTTLDTEGEGPLYLRPIDPVTLKDLPGKRPLGLGGSLWAAISPDGRWLAAAEFETSEGGDPALTLVDTESWSWSQTIAIPELEPISSLAVTDQGTVVWLHSPGDHPYIYRLPKGDTEHELVVDLGTAMWPIVQPAEIGMLTEDHLTLLAFEFDGENYGGFVHVLEVHLETGSISDLLLPDVWHGHIPEADMDADQPFSLNPGWVFDQQSDLLYVVPAQDNEVIAVDLGSMQIRQRVRWDTAESFLDSILAWWVPAANAKGGEVAQRRLELNPDGSRLFVATLTPGRERIEVLDTDTFDVIASIDFMPMDIALAPDGSVLLAIDSFHPEGTESIDGGRLHLLDPDTLTTRAQILPDLDLNLSGYSGFSGDGRHAYAWNYSGESEAILYVVIDLTDPRAVAIRKVYWPGFAIPQAGVLAAADR